MKAWIVTLHGNLQAVLAKIMATFTAAWSWFKASFRRFGRGNNPTPAPQA